jgi:fermentation-respiration switch protein FrsA (DUF1100 family)
MEKLRSLKFRSRQTPKKVKVNTRSMFKSKYILSSIIGTSSILFFWLYYNQEKLIYQPNFAGLRNNFLDPSAFGLNHVEMLTIPSVDNVMLQAWFIKTDEDYKRNPTVLFFHGNAGNLSHRLANIKDIILRLKCNVFILSYRGYGSSQGEPSEEGLKMDAQAALLYLKERDDLVDSPIVVFGRSIGGAVAIDLVSKYNDEVAALILENTFTSIPDMIDHVLPPLKYFKSLCRTQWNSLEAIQRVYVPTLFISGQSDELVPSEMMVMLHDSVGSEVKIFKNFPNGTHNETWQQRGYYQALKQFLESNNLMPNEKNITN